MRMLRASAKWQRLSPNKSNSEKVYSSIPFELHHPSQKEKEEKSWIEIELVNEEDEAVPSEKYKVTLPDASVAQGTLNQNGFVHISGIKEPGTCQITFPGLDKDAWEPA